MNLSRSVSLTTDMWELIEGYADAHGISISKAIARLSRIGYEYMKKLEEHEIDQEIEKIKDAQIVKE